MIGIDTMDNLVVQAMIPLCVTSTPNVAPCRNPMGLHPTKQTKKTPPQYHQHQQQIDNYKQRKSITLSYNYTSTTPGVKCCGVNVPANSPSKGTAGGQRQVLFSAEVGITPPRK